MSPSNQASKKYGFWFGLATFLILTFSNTQTSINSEAWAVLSIMLLMIVWEMWRLIQVHAPFASKNSAEPEDMESRILAVQRARVKIAAMNPKSGPLRVVVWMWRARVHDLSPSWITTGVRLSVIYFVHCIIPLENIPCASCNAQPNEQCPSGRAERRILQGFITEHRHRGFILRRTHAWPRTFPGHG